MLSRILFGIILIVSAFAFQWWISFLLSVFGLFYFNNLYEVIFVGVIIDSLYGKGIEISFLGNFNFIFTVILIVIFIFISNFKKRLLI